MILDGKALAKIEKERLKEEVARIKGGVCLAVILVGDDPASQLYVSSKSKDCVEVGIKSIVDRRPASTTEEELLARIDELNNDPNVNGILVQMPVPKHINEEKVIERINPLKDVDCFHPYNFGRLFAGNSIVEPCTPKGVIRILEHYKIDPAGKTAVVLGRSNIVGKPAAILLMNKNATVTICHSKTKNLEAVCRTADILVAAIGKPLFVKENMVKEGAVVIDVGINRIDDPSKPTGFRTVGDVDFEPVSKIASAITPVPGGIGLMTRAMLLENTLKLALIQQKVG